MNGKLVLFVVFNFIFVTILAVIQIVTKLGFDKITMPQFAPTLAYFLTIILFKDLYKPIIIKVNKIILVKAVIAIIFPLTLFTLTYYIGKLSGINVNIQNNFFQ